MLSRRGGVHYRRSCIQHAVHSGRDSASTRTRLTRKDLMTMSGRGVGGWLEQAIAELTKQMGGLTQEIRGLKNRLDSIDSRLAEGEAWEGRLVKIEGMLDSVEQDLPRGAGHPFQGVGVLLAANRGTTVQNVQGRQDPVLGFGERRHSNASCPISRSRSPSPKGQGK